MRRQRADWMNPVDDEIMEILDDTGAATPQLLADNTGKNNNYLGVRCRELEKYGLVMRPSRGVYTLTDLGERYLAGDLDASDLEPDN